MQGELVRLPVENRCVSCKFRCTVRLLTCIEVTGAVRLLTCSKVTGRKEVYQL